LDSEGDVKASFNQISLIIQIGDFGLATSGTQRAALTSSLNSIPVEEPVLDKSNTRGIGTPFYVAPGHNLFIG